MEKVFNGSYGIVLTPFKPDGGVDYTRLEKQLNDACATCTKGLVVCGSTGEFTALDKSQNMELMIAASQIIAHRKPLICGATAGDYVTTAEYLRVAAAIHADGALVAPPYYFPLSDADVLEFYRRIDECAGGVPIVAYNIPQFTTGISTAVFEKLTGLSSIRGIKNSSGNFIEFMQYLRLRDEKRPDLSVLTGSDELIDASLAVGGDGSFTALGYLLPQTTGGICTAFAAGDTALALRRQKSMLGLLALAGSLTFPFGYKVLAEALGLDLGCSKQAVAPETLQKAAGVRAQMLNELERHKLVQNR